MGLISKAGHTLWVCDIYRAKLGGKLVRGPQKLSSLLEVALERPVTQSCYYFFLLSPGGEKKIVFFCGESHPFTIPLLAHRVTTKPEIFRDHGHIQKEKFLLRKHDHS